jgi:hypothetical protein
LLTSLVSAKVAVAAAAVAISLGGVATAAYAGALPGSAQQIAHDVIGAPAEHHKDAQSGRQRHHDQLAGHALCLAYAYATTHGSATQQAAISSNLVKAAGGAGKVTAYCARLWRPFLRFSHPGCWPPGVRSWWWPSTAASGVPQPSWSPSPQPSPACTPFPRTTLPPLPRHRAQYWYGPQPWPTGLPSPRPALP